MDYHDWYKEMHTICDKLDPWYDIDKIKFYGVYVWTKDNKNDTENPFGKNVFDIYPNEIVFYVKGHVIPEEAMPIIREIQEKLKEFHEEVK